MAVDPTRIDHVAVALARMPTYLRSRTRYRDLLAALVRPFQEIEDALLEILRQRHLDHAEGAQVDQLGERVGEARNGATDAAYKRRIRARIARNRSQALVEDAIRIARLVIHDTAASVQIIQRPPACVVVRIGSTATDADVAEDVIGFLHRAVAGGVRVLVEYSETTPAATFTFDGPAGLGFPEPYTVDLSLYTGSAIGTVLGVRPGLDPGDVSALTVEIAGDSGVANAGTLDDLWPDIVFSFNPGNTSVGDLEAAFASSSWFYVVAAHAASTDKLQDPDDNTGALSPTTVSSESAGGAFAGALE